MNELLQLAQAITCTTIDLLDSSLSDKELGAIGNTLKDIYENGQTEYE